MNKQILSINLPNEINKVFQEYMAMDQVHLAVCRNIDDAIVLLSKTTILVPLSRPRSEKTS